MKQGRRKERKKKKKTGKRRIAKLIDVLEYIEKAKN